MSSIGDVCRVCQEDEEESGSKLLKPCKCNSYIHKRCLLQWTKTKADSDIIDFKKDLNCEICKTNIEYSQPEQNDSKSQIDTTWNMLKLIYERNKNNLAVVKPVLVLVVVPLWISARMIFLFDRVLHQNRWTYTISVAYPLMCNSNKERKKISTDQYNYYYPTYYENKFNYEYYGSFFPTSSWAYYKHFLTNVFIIIPSVLPVIFNMEDNAESSVFYKMYEYEFGIERTAEEQKKETLKMEKLAKIYDSSSTFLKIVEVLIYVTTISLIIGAHSLMQEFVPRYLFHYVSGKYAKEYDHFYNVYYNFIVFSLFYVILLAAERLSYKAFILKHTMKLIIMKYWLEILFHLVELFARKYCRIDSLFTFETANDYAVFQMYLTDMSRILSICTEAIDYIESKLFRNGVFYLFHLRINITGAKQFNTLLIQPLCCSLRKYLRNVITTIIVFFGIGGFGLYILPKDKTPIFPLKIVFSGATNLFVKNLGPVVLNSYFDILNIFIYLPVFHRLASILKLSNYLFDEDNICEKGRYAYRNTIDLKDIKQTTKAKETNKDILLKPCFSQREAEQLFKTGDTSVDAYFIQDGYKIKAANEFTDEDFEKGLMEKVINEEDQSVKEEKLDSTEETKSLQGLYRYVQGAAINYDFCFVPENYKVRLVFFFVSIAIVQNFVIIVLFEMSNIFGSFVLSVPKALSNFGYFGMSNKKSIAEESSDFLLKDLDKDVGFLKMIIGLTVIFVFGKLLKKNESTANNGRLKSLFVLILEKMLFSLLAMCSLLLGLVFAFLLTYLHEITTTTIFGIIPHGMEHKNSRILWFPKPLYLNTPTLFYYSISVIIIGVATIRNYYSSFLILMDNPENSDEMRLHIFKDYFIQMYKLIKKPLLIPFLVHNVLLLTICSYRIIFSVSNYSIQQRLLTAGFSKEAILYDLENSKFSILQKSAFINMDLAALDSNNYWSKVFRVSLLTSVGYFIVSETISFFSEKRIELKAILRDNSINEEDLIIIEK